ncbi:MAG: hypothetical protein EOP07_14805 [Proteobacteria bacterium]|nr:MAG: hypothetical protein EOP07_14805 [Pseudomonadota bacterium]
MTGSNDLALVNSELAEILPDFGPNSMNLALLNILEDFTSERNRLHDTQRAIMNILDDFGSERAYLETTQRAVLNILEDFYSERTLLETTQKAVLNILEDFDYERVRVSGANEKLRTEIDERISVEKALIDKGAALARSNAELEQFAYIASHDLQAPLRTISSFVEILSETIEGVNDETVNRHFTYIVDGVTRMQDLIKALLEYSRVGRETLPFRLLSCTSICVEVMRDLQASIDEFGAKVHCENLPNVMGDYTMLRQLFQNLIGNGIKFRGDRAPEVAITAEKSGKMWIIRVRDNGVGIDPQWVPKLFIIFQRLQTRQKYPGTGIGLAICKKIVDFHGGKIWVEQPTSGSGIIFAFSLPDANEAFHS